jgi:hypothetical protein
VEQLQAIVQSVFILRLEMQLVLASPANHQQESEQLLSRLLVQQQAAQLQSVCIPHQEQQLQMERQANLQRDSLFRQEVLLVQEMAIHLFLPFTHTSELLRLVVLEHLITQSSIQTSELLKVQVLQLQATLH